MTAGTRIIIAACCGLIAAVIGWSSSPTSDPTAVATLRLDDNEVRWPFHDAVIQSQDAALADNETIAVAAMAAGVSPDVIRSAEATVPRNQTIFDVSVTADTETNAVAVADALSAELLAANLRDRTAAASDELAALGAELDEARAELAVPEALLRSGDVTSDERLVLEGRIGVLAERVARLEANEDDLEFAIETARPQLVQVRPARIVGGDRTRAVTAAATGIGASLLVAGVLSTRPQRPALASVAAA